MVCGLFVGYVGCSMVYGLLYDMWAVIEYVGCCMVCGLLNGMWAVVC